jgi:type III restriction enzyme
LRSASASELGTTAELAHWQHSLVREALGTLPYSELVPYKTQLQAIFAALTERDAQGVPRYALQAPQADVRRMVRLAFWCLRSFETQVVPLDDVQAMLLLKADALPGSTTEHGKLYPLAEGVAAIMAADARGERGATIGSQGSTEFEAARALLQAQGLGHMLAAQSAVTAAPELVAKDNSFHYLPYDFSQSGLELGLLQELLKSAEFQASGLEVYYNGARHLTDFRIDCYQQIGERNKPRWQKLGAYTPDFLMLQRAAGGSVNKVLIIEAKGTGFAEQSAYTLRKKFVSSEFLRLNNDKFGYPRFDFIEVAEPPNRAYRDSAQKLLSHALQFFGLQPS